ncbi:hypothetical protein CHUAL_007479 [Chamberlinius hualienensis]
MMQTNQFQSSSQVISEDIQVSRNEIVEHVKTLLYTVGEIDKFAKKIPPEVREDPIVKKGLHYCDLVKEAIDILAKFLESPIGHATTVILWKHMTEVRCFVEIAASLVVATFFVVVGQEILESKADELDLLKTSIETSITFVREKLGEIEISVNKAAEKLQCIGLKKYENADDLRKLMWDFGNCVEEAKLGITTCEVELTNANENIDSAIRKINARLILNGVFRGAIVMTGVLFVCVLVNRKTLNPFVGTAVCVTSAAIALSSKLPRSRKLQDDFMMYRSTQENLHKVVQRLKLHVESHEHRFHAQVTAIGFS